MTFSWQKALGGEAAHGMLILSPRAVERLKTYTPPWPLPKIFRLTNNGKLIEGIFEGETINTPSMLCVEDYLDTLAWAKSIGGLKALIARADANTKAIADWVARTPWIDFLAKDPAIRSNTSVCLKVVDPAVAALAADAQAAFVKSLAAALEKEGVAYDIDAYRDAPPGLRIWCGATVEAARRRGADAVARLGLRQDQGRAAEGGVSRAVVPAKRGPSHRVAIRATHRCDDWMPAFAGDDTETVRINGSQPWPPKSSSPTPSPTPPCRSSRTAASRPCSSPSSAPTRTSSPR